MLSISLLPFLNSPPSALAIKEAKRRRIPVFDFNLSVFLKASPALDVKTVLGPAESTLPTLARLAGATMKSSPAAGSVSNNSGSDVYTPNTSQVTTSTMIEQQDGQVGSISQLGRRAREKNSRGSDVDAMERGGSAKSARYMSRAHQEVGTAIESVMPSAAVGVAGAVSPTGVWGGGAPFLLEPALEVPLRKSQVCVELSEAYSRKSHPDSEVRFPGGAGGCLVRRRTEFLCCVRLDCSAVTIANKSGKWQGLEVLVVRGHYNYLNCATVVCVQH